MIVRDSAMPSTAATIELPEDLQAFAEERVRSGKAATVEEVVLGALEEKRIASLQEALDVGLAQAEARQVVQGTPAELMARIHQRHGVSRSK
jgi:Arc/MetJ-type ribon-helix-helix transcriptional regulator